ncbi:hypothetical protein B0O80DRAFT_425893 [Mortierella sp. GBAus27b]|nr:hypothetical protein B0O80DRAFT_425893 [Mortierella sp. GBAus27b]
MAAAVGVSFGTHPPCSYCSLPGSQLFSSTLQCHFLLVIVERVVELADLVPNEVKDRLQRVFRQWVLFVVFNGFLVVVRLLKCGQVLELDWHPLQHYHCNMLAHRSGPLMCFALTGGNLPYAAISTKVEVNLVESASLSVIERSHFDHFSVPYSNDQFTEIPKRSLLSDVLLSLESRIHGCSLCSVHSTNLEAAKQTFSLIKRYSILCQGVDHSVQASLLAILEEMCLQSVVPRLDVVFRVN